MPKVAIAIPSYNRREYLRQSISSVLRQTFQDLEILVFDNHSDQDIAGLVAEFNDRRVRLVPSEVQLGSFGNFSRIYNYAFASEWLVIFHDDDVMHPRFLERCMRALATEPNAVLCAASNVFVKDARKLNSFESFDQKPLKPEVYKTAADLTRLILSGFNLCFDSVVYKTVILEDNGPFKRFGKWGDRPIVINLAGKGKTLVLKEKLVNYRVHPGQDSQDRNWDSESINQNLDLYEFYLEKLPKPLSPKDERLFYSFAANNLARSVSSFAGNFKETLAFYSLCRKKGLWRWRSLNFKGAVFLGIAFLKLSKKVFAKR